MGSLRGLYFDHRKAWVAADLVELAPRFGAGIHAYAVMSNPVHVVMHVNTGSVANWSEEVLAQRWLRVLPKGFDGCPGLLLVF